MTGESSRVMRIFRSSFPSEEDTGFRTHAWADGVAAVAAELRPVYTTMLHAFAFAAKQDKRIGIKLLPDDPRGVDDHQSYRRLYHRACAMAVGLRERGVGDGQPVLLVLPTSLEFVAGLFAIQLAGGVPVPAYPPAMLSRAAQAIERLRQIAESSGATICVTDRRLKPLLGEVAATGRLRQVVTTEVLERADRKLLPDVRVRPEDPALIQYTSGSTDRPKGVLLSHRNLVSNIHAIGQAARINRNDSVVIWLPLYHDMGLIGGLMFSIYWQLPLALMSPLQFLADPLRWLRTISRERATLSPAPNFAYGLCVKRAESESTDELDLSSWRLALNGAEPVNPATVEAFHGRFARHGFEQGSMLPVYGLAECSLAVAFPAHGAAPELELVDREQLAAGVAVPASGERAVAVTSVGQAVPGHTCTVVDEYGVELGEREVGHIVVSGPSVMQGYYGNPSATDAVLRGESLWTGDLGFVCRERLFVVGRAKDLIIVRGGNYYAEDLERVVCRVAGVRPGGAVAFGVYDEAEAVDLVVIVCETRVQGTEARLALVQEISSAVSEQCGVPVDEVVLTSAGTIPKTPSAKAQRGLCR
ncbi:MAG TPA: fatty acyl-AMP ligase, partial [Kofleriaceae bacterium]|nr:fatty acyl-AMP ligase [Kofleriaceae bacterium]